MNLSLVIPLYNEEESLRELCEWIGRVLSGAGLSYEIILVDDGSIDRSWQEIGKLSEGNKNIRGGY